MATAMDLARNNIVAIDISALSDLEGPALCHAVEPACVPHGAVAAVLLPRLQHVTARLMQVKLLSALAAATAPGSVKQLSLWCCNSCKLGRPAASTGLLLAPIVDELSAAGQFARSGSPRAYSRTLRQMLVWLWGMAVWVPDCHPRTIPTRVIEEQPATGAVNLHASALTATDDGVCWVCIL